MGNPFLCRCQYRYVLQRLDAPTNHLISTNLLTMEPPRDAFPSTSWSLVDRAARGEDAAQASLASLLIAYLSPLKTHLIRKGLARREEADDLVQGFIADKVIERELISSADRNRGKFRTFLATSLERYVTSEYRRQHALKRRPSSGLQQGGERLNSVPSSTDLSVDSYDIAWAKQVIHQALSEMKQACEEHEDPRCWKVFHARILRATIDGLDPVSYAEIIEAEGFASYSQATKALYRAKQLYIEYLRAVVGRYVSGPEEIDREIGELQGILAASVRKL